MCFIDVFLVNFVYYFTLFVFFSSFLFYFIFLTTIGSTFSWVCTFFCTAPYNICMLCANSFLVIQDPSVILRLTVFPYLKRLQLFWRREKKKYTITNSPGIVSESYMLVARFYYFFSWKTSNHKKETRKNPSCFKQCSCFSVFLWKNSRISWFVETRTRGRQRTM